MTAGHLVQLLLTMTKTHCIIQSLITMSHSIDIRLEALRAAPLNSWIAMSEDETKVVATGATYAEVVNNSEKAGVTDPVLIKTPKSWLPLAV